MTYTVRFGHIPMRLDLLWSAGQVKTLEGFESTKSWLMKYAHPDGHYYPPVVETYAGWPPAHATPVPNSRRGALLHQLPPTHELVLSGYEPTDDQLRNGAAGFVIHFLGFLLGRRAQFEDWWVDGRVPTRAQTDAVPFHQRAVSVCLDVAVGFWNKAAAHEQRVITNAMFLHNRSPSYEWSWERFIAEYQVFDALYRVATRLHSISASSHAKRYLALAERFGLLVDRPKIERIVSLRNELLHEALWVGSLPTAGGGEDGFYVPLWLRHINQRLGLAVLGFTGPYVRSSWYSLMQHFLDLDQLK